MLMAISAAFLRQLAAARASLAPRWRNKVSLVFPLQSLPEKIKSISGLREVMAQQWFGALQGQPPETLRPFAIIRKRSSRFASR